MADNSSSSSSGIGFTGLLTIIFIVLKLLGKISWPWFWVLSPIWISFSLFLGFFAILALIAIFASRR